jgi:hypothetical protein
MRFSCEGGARLALPIHNSNLEDCLRLGRNYTLAVTETVRRSKLLRLTGREYPAGDTHVKRNYSSPWYQAARVRFATDPGAARTMNRSEMLGRRHSEKDRGWRPGTSRAWHIAVISHSTSHGHDQPRSCPGTVLREQPFRPTTVQPEPETLSAGLPRP